MSRLDLFSRKNVLVTGASRGLGKEVALKYASTGANLILVGRNEATLKEVQQEVCAKGPGVVDIQVCNLERPEDIFSMVERLNSKMTVDVLVNCAGVFPISTIRDTSVEDYQNCMNINVTAPFLLIKGFVDGMVQNKWGRIINIASSSAYAGGTRTSVYCASKHALLGLSRSLFKELKQYNVLVSCISPGSIKTSMGREVEKLGQEYDTFIEPAEIADFIVNNTAFDGNMIAEEVRLNRVFIQ